LTSTLSPAYETDRFSHASAPIARVDFRRGHGMRGTVDGKDNAMNLEELLA
jgi:hypothetical protein